MSHAIRQYNSLSSENCIAAILLSGLAEDDKYVDDLNYNKSIVINAFFREILTNEEKKAYQRRDNFINACPKPGQFSILPPQLLDEQFHCKMLQLEVCEFSGLMERALTSESMCDVALLQKFKLPYKVLIQTVALRRIHVSNVLLALILVKVSAKIFSKVS